MRKILFRRTKYCYRTTSWYGFVVQNPVVEEVGKLKFETLQKLYRVHFVLISFEFVTFKNCRFPYIEQFETKVHLVELKELVIDRGY